MQRSLAKIDILFRGLSAAEIIMNVILSYFVKDPDLFVWLDDKRIIPMSKTS